MTIRQPNSLLAWAVIPFAYLFSTHSALALETVSHQPGKVVSANQWDVVEISFEVSTVPIDMFEVEFGVTFTGDSDVSLKIPGFFNGDNEFLVRFTPPSAGNWKYVTHSPISQLDGNQGSVDAVAASDGRRGGIAVDPNVPRQFHNENGNNYYPIAFECDWLFALHSENSDDIPKTRKFVDTLADSGFNQVLMNVFAYDVKWKKDDRLTTEHDFGSLGAFPFGGTNSDPDHSQINIDYFKRLDCVIEYLDRKGIAAHLMIYAWNKRVNWPEADSDADNRYFDYVVRRYQAYPNLVWDVSKEALAYGHTDVPSPADHFMTLALRLKVKRVFSWKNFIPILGSMAARPNSMDD